MDFRYPYLLAMGERKRSLTSSAGTRSARLGRSKPIRCMCDATICKNDGPLDQGSLVRKYRMAASRHSTHFSRDILTRRQTFAARYGNGSTRNTADHRLPFREP